MTNPIRTSARSRRAAALALLLTLLLPSLALAGEEIRLEAEDASATVHAVLTFRASPLVAMTRVPFELEVRDAAGIPLENAVVRCDLTMPAMAMPVNRPQVEERGGAYGGEAVFTMAGAWEATFDLTFADGREVTLVFPLERVLLK